jgi:hypothetical protein
VKSFNYEEKIINPQDEYFPDDDDIIQDDETN